MRAVKESTQGYKRVSSIRKKMSSELNLKLNTPNFWAYKDLFWGKQVVYLLKQEALGTVTIIIWGVYPKIPSDHPILSSLYLDINVLPFSIKLSKTFSI